MKELTIEEKARRYDEALERARKEYKNHEAFKGYCEILEHIFTELKEKESKDEKIRKELINYFIKGKEYLSFCSFSKDEILAWLEKQGEQEEPQVYETEDGEVITYSESEGYKVVEPKFKVGDWITNGATNPAQISSIKDGMYFTHNDTIGGDIESIDKEYHLWTIQDAKDGDVICSGQMIILFKKWEDSDWNFVIAYAGIDITGKLQITDGHWLISNYAHPATKEQRDTLFAKMKEAGYEWDAEKKELKKIENEIEIPFGAKDSELQEATYYIPKGFHAEIYDDKVVFKKAKKPTAWSEEDEVRLQACLDTLQARSIMGKVDTIMTIWLKSLKDRILPQPKQEWSEEDEEHVNSLLKRLEGLCRKEFATTRFAINEDENWLKSLRPQNRWKPSDEQMTALRRMKAAIAGEGEIYKPLNSLYEDLKKLREE